MWSRPSARNCSMIAWRPVRAAATAPACGAARAIVLPAPAREAVLEHLDHLLARQVRVRRRASRHERVVDDHRPLVAVVAVVGAAWLGGVAEDELQRIRRRAHHEARAHEARAVLVVVLEAVAGHVLARDDAAAGPPGAGGEPARGAPTPRAQEVVCAGENKGDCPPGPLFVEG